MEQVFTGRIPFLDVGKITGIYSILKEHRRVGTGLLSSTRIGTQRVETRKLWGMECVNKTDERLLVTMHAYFHSLHPAGFQSPTYFLTVFPLLR